MQEVMVLDRQGQVRDWAWLIAEFGAMRLERAPLGGKAYRLVKLQEVEGPAILLVHVADERGEPLAGIPVVRSWPDSPELPTWPEPTSRWRERGVLGPTDSSGTLGFGLGTADAYSAPQVGSSCAWVADPAGPSDLVTGLGMLASANHRHLNLYFQLMELRAEVVPVTTPKQESSQATNEPTQPASPILAAGPPAAAAVPIQLSEAEWDLLIRRLDVIIETLERRAGKST